MRWFQPCTRPYDAHFFARTLRFIYAYEVLHVCALDRPFQGIFGRAPFSYHANLIHVENPRVGNRGVTRSGMTWPWFCIIRISYRCVRVYIYMCVCVCVCVCKCDVCTWDGHASLLCVHMYDCAHVCLLVRLLSCSFPLSPLFREIFFDW